MNSLQILFLPLHKLTEPDRGGDFGLKSLSAARLSLPLGSSHFPIISFLV